MAAVTLEAGYGEGTRASRAQEPEMRLLTAVLMDAVRCYTRRPAEGPGVKARLAREARDWIFGAPGADALFSFTSVCDHLGIEAQRLRSSLRAGTAPGLAIEDA